MSYFFSKTLQTSSFEEAVIKTKEALKKEEFGVIGEIDFQKTFKEKLGVDFRKYIVLQACSPADAYKSIIAEEKIGLLLPCNLLVQEKGDGIEICSINPDSMMQGLENEKMQEIATDVSQKLQQVINRL